MNVTSQQTPTGAVVIGPGADKHERDVIADREQRYRALTREVVALEDLLKAARDEADTAEQNARGWRMRAAQGRQRVAELEAKLEKATLALRLGTPPLAEEPTGLVPPAAEPPAAPRSYTETVAAAYGFASPRAMLRSQFLSSLPEKARAAIEANEAELERALDLANGGAYAEALAVAHVLVAKPAAAEAPASPAVPDAADDTRKRRAK